MHEIIGILGILAVLSIFIYGIFVISKPHNFQI